VAVPHPGHRHLLRHGGDDRAAAPRRDRRRRNAAQRDRDRRVEPRGPHRPGDPAPGAPGREEQQTTPRSDLGGASLPPPPHARPAARPRRGDPPRRWRPGEGGRRDDRARRRGDVPHRRAEPVPRGDLPERRQGGHVLQGLRVRGDDREHRPAGQEARDQARARHGGAGHPGGRPRRGHPAGVQGARGPAQHDQPGRLGEDLGQEGRADRVRAHPGARAGLRRPHRRAVHRAGRDRPVPVGLLAAALRARRTSFLAVAVPKICGIETEYGILVRGTNDSNPVAASSLLINAYLSALEQERGRRRNRVGWDFEDEQPGVDARGEVLAALAPEVETHLVNAVLTNGARYYVDHAHPEYSAPESAHALEALLYDRAGEEILRRSMDAARSSLPEGQEIVVYQNNSDGKGNSYGCHENYLLDRATPFQRIVTHATTHLVSRQVFTGAGKVGSEAPGTSRDEVGFQLTQRADFFEEEVGLETTLKRPIINTRDEPHADAQKYRRLHVITGDANLSEVATFLKLGTTALVLAMVDD